MFKKIFLVSAFFLSALTYVYAQVGQGALKGKITDSKTGEAMPFVNIVVKKNGNQITGGTSDINGNYTIKPIPPGKYTVIASFIGYTTKQVDGVEITGDKISFLDIKMSPTSVTLQTVEIVTYTKPLFEKDNTVSGETVTSEEITKMATRSVRGIATTVSGVVSKDGEISSIRGGRKSSTVYFIDGIKVRGSTALPQQAIEQVNVLLGGLPAMYGDVTGGVISITTKGASQKFFGGGEFYTSGFKIGNKIYGLDKFGNNLLAFNLSGPLLSKKDTAGNKKPLLGFFLATELRSNVDPNPSAIGIYKLKDSTLNYLRENPLRASGLEAGGTFLNADFVRKDQFEWVATRQNVSSKRAVLQGKIDVAAFKNANLTFGGTFDYINRIRFSSNFSLMNWFKNPQNIDNTWRVYGRFVQRFNQENPNENKEESIIKNAFISFQVDYSKLNRIFQDANHKDKFFDYGYYGKFTSAFKNSYEFGTTTLSDGSTIQGYIHNGFDQQYILFQRDSSHDVNPDLARITEQYYELSGDQIVGNYETMLDVQQNGGLINGDAPRNVYNLWYLPGTQYNLYQKIDNNQFRISGMGSADIKDHAITLGFEFEQRIDRSYALNPRGLWTYALNYTNRHIEQLDTSKYTITYDGTYPTITYERLYDASSQEYFDYNLRKALGKPTDGKEWIDVLSYSPDIFSIDFFSADELLVSGNSLVSYYGFDHTGKKVKGNPTLTDFFTEKDEFGNFKRLIPPFQPIYMAGYIQDKFAFKDLIFNIGLRVDRFDANQPVLKDPYSLFETVKAGEVTSDRPSNIGDDFVVYVSDINDPKEENIVGYRDPKTNKWYNAEGTPITDPHILDSPIGIAPWLRKPGFPNVSTDLTADAFEDYKPQINVMPRLAFSFPISDVALFFAHYDILTKRPSRGLRMDPTDYLFIQNTSSVLNNPNLKPEKTIDYEFGFQQKLNTYSALKISAFYREQRDMIQIINITGAFPVDYKTYGNIDFGTVKGFTVSYDLRRKKNVMLRANYTLQFADATGSDETAALNLVNSGQPNLRAIFPTSFDRRHNFAITVDYRYFGGKNYNGPEIKGKKILENTGLNVTFIGGSGTPYSKQSNILGSVFISSSSNAILSGTINGSRLPWQFRMDARLDRDIKIKYGKGDENGNKKHFNLNVYLQVLNVLNAKNIINVYAATGQPDDDGYLSSPDFQQAIIAKNDSQAFKDQYNVKVNDPGNYSLPRRIRIGAIFSF